MPCFRAARARPRSRPRRADSDSAAKMPPVCSQRTPSSPKRWSKSMSPGFSWLIAVWPRSETPTAPRTPKPRSVKLRPLRTVRPTPSDGTQRIEARVDAAGQDEVLDETADLVVDERGDDRAAQTEDPAQSRGRRCTRRRLPRPGTPGRCGCGPHRGRAAASPRRARRRRTCTRWQDAASIGAIVTSRRPRPTATASAAEGADGGEGAVADRIDGSTIQEPPTARYAARLR